ncbi:hypothetical protein SLA2020_436090 [Shorea laevis]
MDLAPILIQGYRSLPCGNPAEVWFLFDDEPRPLAMGPSLGLVDPRRDFRFSRVSKCVVKDKSVYFFGGQRPGQEGNTIVRCLGSFSRCSWRFSRPLNFSLKETTLAVAGDIIYLLPHDPLHRGQYEPENVAYLYNIRSGNSHSINRPTACPNCSSCNGSIQAWHPHFCATIEGGALLATAAEGNTLCLHKYDPHLQTWRHCCQFKDIPQPVSDHEYAVFEGILFFSFNDTTRSTALYVIDVATLEVLKQYKFRLDSICGKQSRFLVALSYNQVCYLCYDRNILSVTRLKLLSDDFDKAPEFSPSNGSTSETVIGKCKGNYLTEKRCKYVPVVSRWARIEVELEGSFPIAAEGLLSCVLCDPGGDRRLMELLKKDFLQYYKFNLRREFPAEVRIRADSFEDAWFPVRLLPSSLREAVIRFENLRTEEVQELFRKPRALYFRPSPPEINVPHYEEGDEVDGWYEDSWRKGVFLTVLPNSKYIVQLQNVFPEQYLHRSQVRIHQDWTKGNWVIASQRVQEILGIADPFAASSDSDSNIEEYLSILFADLDTITG